MLEVLFCVFYFFGLNEGGIAGPDGNVWTRVLWACSVLILSTGLPDATSTAPTAPGTGPGGDPSVGPDLIKDGSYTWDGVTKGTRRDVGPARGLEVVIRAELT